MPDVPLFYFISTCFVCQIISTHHCHILPLLCYAHMLVACFVSLTLCPHHSTVYSLCNIMSASSCYVFSLSYNTHISLHLLSLSHYVHTSVPCSGSVILCTWCSTIFYLSHIMLLSHYHSFPLLLYACFYHILSCFKHVLKGKYSTKVWNPQILYVWISVV